MRRVERTDRTDGGETLLEIQMQTYQQHVLTSRRAEELFATHGKTFHFAARFIPTTQRTAVVTLYAFFRTLDDLVDERTENWQVDDVRQELDAWRTWFCHGYTTPAPREPLGATLAGLVQEYQIPVALFEDFLDGLVSDLGTQEFADFQALYRYCYQVAGTVGLAMAHVLGARSNQAIAAAKHLGIAMQLTNILRDVGGDLASGRIYLPQNELARFGCPSAYLHRLYQAGQGPDERFRALMRFQIERANRYYVEGLHGIWLLRRNSRLPILLAGRLYQRILSVIERRNYDVLRGRAATTLFTKLNEAGVAFLLERLWRQGEVELPIEIEVLYES